MQLLTDDDKALLVLEHLGPAALAGDTMSLYDCFQLALDVAEKALLAKLGAMELPEPVVQRTKESKEKTLDDWFYASNPAYAKAHSSWKWESLHTAAQLHQAYAQGAAA
ncbi:MAG: hypothetical protein QE279_01905, partial [Rhodoferax sp.]|nr:hypothetical protein [Rhodoferax sp.]